MGVSYPNDWFVTLRWVLFFCVCCISDMGHFNATKGKQALEIRSSLSERRALTDPILPGNSAELTHTYSRRWAKAHGESRTQSVHLEMLLISFHCVVQAFLYDEVKHWVTCWDSQKQKTAVWLTRSPTGWLTSGVNPLHLHQRIVRRWPNKTKKTKQDKRQIIFLPFTEMTLFPKDQWIDPDSEYFPLV